jgi:hypothetical protein
LVSGILVADLTIAGKRVTVRESFRGREWWSLPALYRKAWAAARKGDYTDTIPFLARVVESWEFDGDPALAATYEQLDAMAELMPLADGAVLAVNEAAFPKAKVGS